jgi:hypothetical protein
MIAFPNVANSQGSQNSQEVGGPVMADLVTVSNQAANVKDASMVNAEAERLY